MILPKDHPRKKIRRALQDQQEEQLQPNDLRSVAMAVYRRRRKTYPPLPKSQSETHEVLPTMNIQTNKFEEFLQLNHPDQGMIVFTCRNNLECLCSVTELFMDGTYKFFPKFFKFVGRDVHLWKYLVRF